tara:strand:+ start:762 stop:1028 length:267 start_codon:yes stop_codon:yes gene_type:complete
LRRNKLPRYTYECSVCLEYFEVSHSISEKLTDCQCGASASLVRVPSIPFRVSPKGKHKPGQIVKDYIQDAKRDIEEYKKDMAKGIKDE